jgi:integrase/recombinase XerC
MVTADKLLSEPQLNRFLKRLRSEKDKSVSSIQSSVMPLPKEVRTVMDYFLFTLIANTGLRISEALNLRWSDIHDDFLVVRQDVSKNGKKGSVYFGTKTKALLNELKKSKPAITSDVTDFLFSVKGKVATRCYMHVRFKFWLHQTDLPSTLSIHSLRHTYGTQCLDKGLSLTFVRDNLRHSNISITSQYLHLTQESRDRVKNLF